MASCQGNEEKAWINDVVKSQDGIRQQSPGYPKWYPGYLRSKMSCGLWNVVAKGVPEAQREITLNQHYKRELQWPL